MEGLLKVARIVPAVALCPGMRFHETSVPAQGVVRLAALSGELTTVAAYRAPELVSTGMAGAKTIPILVTSSLLIGTIS